MSTATRKKLVTFDEFCRLVPDGQKADLIDGVIYMASPDNWNAGLLFSWLYRLVGTYVEKNHLGEVVGSRNAFKLTDINSPEPDIAFVRKSRVHLAEAVYFPGGPDLSVEIVSPDSVKRDYGRKRELYEQAGVREYWILDEIKAHATFLRLDRSGAFREVRPRKGVFTSRAVSGFWLRVEWLWQSPRPEVLVALAEIESGGK
jgi:Uma2 family endonuclease